MLCLISVLGKLVLIALCILVFIFILGKYGAGGPQS